MDAFSFVVGFLAGNVFAWAGAVVAVRIVLPYFGHRDITPARPPEAAKDVATILPGRVFEPIAKLGLAPPWSGLPDLPGQTSEVFYGPFQVKGFGQPGYVDVDVLGLVGDLVRVRACNPPHHQGVVHPMQFHPHDRVLAHEACAKLPKSQRPDVVVDPDG